MELVKSFVRGKLREHRYRHLQRLNNGQYREVMRVNGIADRACQGEEEWLAYWQRFGVKVSPVQYRVFHHYLGPNIHFVPEEICNCFVEPALCPELLRGPYLDKNFFDRLLPEGFMPATVCRRMEGRFYDSNYRPIALDDKSLCTLLEGCEAIIVKPSFNSTQGDGIQLFRHDGDGGWHSASSREPLSMKLLDSLIHGDFIMQQAVGQSAFTAQFNHTSVNTLRLAVYRSVIDESPHIVGSIMRFGSKGSIADNVHTGGYFVGIRSDGTVADTLFSQQAVATPLTEVYPTLRVTVVPNWQAVVSFAKEVSLRIPHHRLLALDIALDHEDKPCLLEFNIHYYSTWFFQYTAGSAFGDYCDEIIDYSLKSDQPRILRF